MIAQHHEWLQVGLAFLSLNKERILQKNSLDEFIEDVKNFADAVSIYLLPAATGHIVD